MIFKFWVKNEVKGKRMITLVTSKHGEIKFEVVPLKMRTSNNIKFIYLKYYTITRNLPFFCPNVIHVVRKGIVRCMGVNEVENHGIYLDLSFYH